ncbi:hypothetical protein DRO22_01430 [Candidatus Bathyarchaeota archaeon]|nr:MAG: hypothetical protein DRO22_01430 [Candidatus Bathyarchaeota archaeon]
MTVLAADNLVKILQNYGVDKEESQIYVHLLIHGPSGAGAIAKSLGVNRVKVYRILKRLEEKGMVEAILGRPVKYLAMPLEEAVNGLIENEKKRIRLMEAEKKKLLEAYEKIAERQPRIVEPKFRILHGRKAVFNFLSGMFERAREEIALMTTVNDLYRFTYVGLDEVLKRKAQNGVKVEILTETNEKTIEIIETYLGFAEVYHRKLPGAIRFITIDEKEAFTSVLMDDSISLNIEKDAGLWTNSADYVEAMKRFFEDFWSRGADATIRIKELRSLLRIRRSLMSLNEELSRKGWILEMPGENEGNSGIKHRFDMIIRNVKDSRLLVADFVVRRDKTLPSLMALYTKALDVEPSSKFLIIDNFALTEEEENLAKRYEIEITQEANVQNLLSHLKTLE